MLLKTLNCTQATCDLTEDTYLCIDEMQADKLTYEEKMLFTM